MHDTVGDQRSTVTLTVNTAMNFVSLFRNITRDIDCA